MDELELAAPMQLPKRLLLPDGSVVEAGQELLIKPEWLDEKGRLYLTFLADDSPN